jgi:hypothetical protein
MDVFVRNSEHNRQNGNNEMIRNERSGQNMAICPMPSSNDLSEVIRNSINRGGGAMIGNNFSNATNVLSNSNVGNTSTSTTVNYEQTIYSFNFELHFPVENV